MSQHNTNFVSYIETRIQSNNTLYSRFHIGNFPTGQALTIANTLRRILLSQIPSFVISKVEIEGVRHEFDSILDIKENILDVILNLKNVYIYSNKKDIIHNQNRESIASINFLGPGTITAKDIQFPDGLLPVYLNSPIATCSDNGHFSARLFIKYIDPLSKTSINQFEPTQRSQLLVNIISQPILQVNYTINKTNISGSEYISLEIWSNGSVDPKVALQYTLEMCTRSFFTFSTLARKLTTPII